MDSNMVWVVIGIAMLFWGRRLFWVIIGTVGFVFGFSTVQSLIPDQAIWFYLIAAALCAGLIITLVKLLKNIAFGLGGFVLGAYVGDGVMQILGTDLGWISWLVLFVCGVVGAILMLKLFDWAVIILSSAAGALLITQAIPGEAPGIQILFFGLILLGFIAQVRKNRPATFSPKINPLPPGLTG